MIWNLIDDSFKHDIGMVAGQPPKNITWDREFKTKAPVFYTNKVAFTDFNTPYENNYFILSEPCTIIKYTPEIIDKIKDRFKLIFTHDSRYLQRWPEKCRWINGGGIWIGGKTGKGLIKLHQKSKLCSFVSSDKIFCDLHYFRVSLSRYLINKVDVFGTIINKESWVPINQTLEDYYFSIIIENHIDDLYFTEKLLNCFATGTIPIYIGARKIDSIFNINGIIQLHIENKTFNECYKWFDDIINRLSPELYHYALPAVIENFNICQQFITIEDYIYNNYKDKII